MPPWAAPLTRAANRLQLVTVMVLHIPLDRAAGRTLQDQIYAHLRALIEQGKLGPGTRLPSINQLAAGWAVARNTVILSITRLTDEGYVISQPARGLFVHRQPPAPQRNPDIAPDRAGLAVPQDLVFFHAPPVALPADRGAPVRFDYDDDYPVFRQQSWRRLVQQTLLRRGHEGGHFQPNRGMPALRQALAEWLYVHHGIRADQQQIIITSGLQQAHAITAQLLISPGDTVVVESPCYEGKPILYGRAGARVVQVPIDREGIAIGPLPEQARLACVNPGSQLPSAVTMTLGRRREFSAWLARTGAWVFEETMNDLLRLEGADLPPLRNLGGADRAIYGGVLAPLLGAGLALGFMVLPEALVEPAIQAKLGIDSGQSWVDQEVLARFIQSGELDAYLRRKRSILRQRRDLLLTLVARYLPWLEPLASSCAPRASFLIPPNGPAIEDLIELARQAGIALPFRHLHGEMTFRERASAGSMVLLCYGGLSEATIEDGIRRLERAFAPVAAQLA